MSEDERVADLEQLLAVAEDEAQELAEINKSLKQRNSDMELFISNFAENARRILNQNG